MEIKKRVRLEQIGVRITPETRDKVKSLAKEKGVRESDIYRSIIDSFFAPIVSKTETNSLQ